MSRASLFHNVFLFCVIVGIGFPSSAGSDEPNSGDTSDQLIGITVPEGNHPQNEKIWKEAQVRWACLDAGNRSFKTGDYQTALGHYIKASQLAVLGFERIEPTNKVVMTYEALGDFSKAIEAANDLLGLMGQAPATPETLGWKQALEAAAQGRYDLAIQYYRERLSSARGSEKKALFLEQRLRLMEERAHASGQLSTKTGE